MSMVSKEEIVALSRLARLRLSESEVADLQGELSTILEHMKLLSEVDTEGVLPMTHVGQGGHELRPDLVRPSLNRDRVLAAAARSEDGCFAVPAILPRGDKG